MSHWTSERDESLINKITFDFIAQLERRIDENRVKQSELAEKLGVSEGAVSQVLNFNRTNLNLKTMVRYARALGMKLSIVAYDDGDPQNVHGPVGSELFADAWQRLGKPRSAWELNHEVQPSYSDESAHAIGVQSAALEARSDAQTVIAALQKDALLNPQSTSANVSCTARFGLEGFMTLATQSSQALSATDVPVYLIAEEETSRVFRRY